VIGTSGSSGIGGGGSGGSNSYFYRSPLIMRNEKLAMPAPPEYTRQSSLAMSNATHLNQIMSSAAAAAASASPAHYNNNGNTVIQQHSNNLNFLNEIKAMLTQEKIGGQSSDESIQMLIHSNYNYPTDLPSYKSSSSSESPQPLTDLDNDQAQLIYKPSQAHHIPLISLKDVVSRRSESAGRITTSGGGSSVLTTNQMNSFNQLNLQQQQQLKKLLP
jgi:hypothetical protein